MVEIDIQINDTDALTWNGFLNRSKPDIYNIYQTYEWASLKKHADGLIPIFVRVTDGSEICGEQLYFKKKEFGTLTAYSSLGGPICASNRTGEIEKHIIEHMHSKGRYSLYIRARPGIFSNLNAEFIKKGFTKLPVYYFIVDIDRDEKVLWKGIERNARRKVEKAGRNGIAVTEAEEWNLWVDFHKLHVQHCKIKNLEPRNLAFFKELYEQFRPKKMAKLFVASYADSIVAGSLFLCYDKNMAYHINASDENYTKFAPNDLILWNAMLWGNHNGFKTLDLDDTWPDPTSPYHSIHKFKEKWGGHLEEGSVYYYGKAYLFGKYLAKMKNNMKCYPTSEKIDLLVQKAKKMYAD